MKFTLTHGEAMRLIEALARNASRGTTEDVQIRIEDSRFLRVQGFHACQVAEVTA